jgi:hypothetical protein
MSLLCYDCTTDFVAEIFESGYGIKGVSYVKLKADTDAIDKCDRCGCTLPESPKLEAQAKCLLAHTVYSLRQRNRRAIRVLEGESSGEPK